MIETDEQRRWWFATHPEYSWSRRRARTNRREDEKAEPPAYSPEEIDAYVEEGLKYFPTGPVAVLLKALKWSLGTNDGPTPLDFLFNSTDLDKGQHTPENQSSEDKNGENAREHTFFDALVKGIQNTLDGEPWWDPLFKTGVFGSSRKLRQEMKKDGIPIPDDHAAHHIVPETDARFPEAEEARKILKEYDIPLDSSPNGVALPNKLGIGEGEYHPGIHTRRYYREVVKLLRRATSKKKAIQVLKDIGEQLSKGEFPK